MMPVLRAHPRLPVRSEAFLLSPCAIIYQIEMRCLASYARMRG